MTFDSFCHRNHVQSLRSVIPIIFPGETIGYSPQCDPHLAFVTTCTRAHCGNNGTPCVCVCVGCVMNMINQKIVSQSICNFNKL